MSTPAANDSVDILYDLMDEGIIGSDGERCGRVDDIVVEDVFDRPPRVTALLSGGGAKSQFLWPPFLHRFSLWLHARLGMPEPIKPAEIVWNQVERLDDDVILKIAGDGIGANALNHAVARRFIGRIPGANG